MKRPVAILLACALMAASPASADTIADLYKGKSVTIVVGYPPASGYTFYGQILARHLGGHIPGRPNVIV
jgi:adenine/guanine phosphoribosyltransferase-like PRPP-binding protein